MTGYPVMVVVVTVVMEIRATPVMAVDFVWIGEMSPVFIFEGPN